MANPAVISSRSLPFQVAKELDDIYRVTLAEWDTEYNQVLKVQSAPAGPHYYQAEITGLDSLPQEISENDGVTYAVPVEGNPIMRRYRQFGLGYMITDLMLKDELYGKMKKLPADLAKAMRVLNDIEGLRLFNEAELNGTVGTAPGVAEVKDGKALCAGTGHVLLNDVMNFQQDGSSHQVNTLAGRLYNIPYTSGDLSETTFAAAQEYFKQMVDENGFPMKLTPGKLIVPYGDAYIAHRLRTQSFGGSLAGGGLEGSVTTSGGIENAHMLNFSNPSNGFVKGWSVVESRFMDDDRWFFTAEVDEGPGFYWKDQPKQTSEVEFDTDAVKYKAKQRFNVWAYEYRGVYGNISGNARATDL
jgi:hypothetical protein